tara:strand:+ start:2186 stop:2884 length:699 start_codon:yes stop_codon:yes gene_type:complete
MYCFLFFISWGLQELIPLKYDKQTMSNIIVRSYHSVGCIYYLTPLLLKIDHPLVEIEYSRMPYDIEFVLTRSATYFMWDIFSISISNEPSKSLYILHHIISWITIVYPLYYEINWYLVSLGLFLGEVTNPLSQVSAICTLFNYYNNTFEKWYFMFMLFIRGFICPWLIIILIYDLGYKYGIYGSNVLTQSMFINFFTMISITSVSFDWLNNKYKQILLKSITSNHNEEIKKN